MAEEPEHVCKQICPDGKECGGELTPWGYTADRPAGEVMCFGCETRRGAALIGPAFQRLNDASAKIKAAVADTTEMIGPLAGLTGDYAVGAVGEIVIECCHNFRERSSTGGSACIVAVFVRDEKNWWPVAQDDLSAQLYEQVTRHTSRLGDPSPSYCTHHEDISPPLALVQEGDPSPLELWL